MKDYSDGRIAIKKLSRNCLSICLAVLTIACATASSVTSYAFNNSFSDIMPANDTEITTSTQAPDAEGNVVFTNRSFAQNQLQYISVSNPGAKVRVDNTYSDAIGAIASRSWFDPALAMAGFIPGGKFDSESTRLVAEYFSTYFKNDPMYVYELNNKGALPGTVHIAIWLPGQASYAYAYRTSDNTYKAINSYLDSVGYIHAEYDVGDYLIFTRTPLEYK